MSSDPRVTSRHGDGLCLRCFKRPLDPQDVLCRCYECAEADIKSQATNVQRAAIFSRDERPTYTNRRGELVRYGRIDRHPGAE